MSLSIIFDDLEVITRHSSPSLETLTSFRQTIWKKKKKTSINVDQKFQCQRRAIVTIIPVRERIPISKASRSHLTRTVTYVSRHREIIAINATDGERIFPYLCARIVCHWVIDRRPLSGRQLLRGTTTSSSRGKPPGESHKISTALYFYAFQRLFIGRFRAISSALVRARVDRILAFRGCGVDRDRGPGR